tara:strand:+ start:996 stop:1373 length:378 start_codon:yes stop_codon:yes gene_type:complete
MLLPSNSGRYIIHSIVDQYKSAAPRPVANSIEPHEKYENVSLPSKFNFLDPTGEKAIIISIKKIVKPMIKKYDSKLIAKNSYIDFKDLALSFGFVKTYDERIIKKEKVMNKTDLFHNGFIFTLNI